MSEGNCPGEQSVSQLDTPWEDYEARRRNTSSLLRASIGLIDLAACNVHDAENCAAFMHSELHLFVAFD